MKIKQKFYSRRERQISLLLTLNIFTLFLSMVSTSIKTLSLLLLLLMLLLLKCFVFTLCSTICPRAITEGKEICCCRNLCKMCGETIKRISLHLIHIFVSPFYTIPKNPIRACNVIIFRCHILKISISCFLYLHSFSNVVYLLKITAIRDSVSLFK